MMKTYRVFTSMILALIMAIAYFTIVSAATDENAPTRPSFFVESEVTATDGSTLLFSEMISKRPDLNVYGLSVGGKISQIIDGKLAKICAFGETGIQYSDWTYELTITEEMRTVGFAEWTKENNIHIGSSGNTEKVLLTFAISDYPTINYKPMEPLYSAGSIISGVGSTNSLILDGKEHIFPAVNIDGHNCLKIRDMAMILNGTKKQFSIDWDEKAKAITFTSGKPYIPTGVELTETIAGQINASATSQKFIINGNEVSLSAYNINGSNYLQLVDLAVLLDFNVIWEAQTKTITLDLDSAYSKDNHIVRTYDELLEASKSALNQSGSRRNIYIRGDITIPEGSSIGFMQTIVTIDEGYTLTPKGHFGIGYNGNQAVVINIKGTLVIGTDRHLSVSDSAVINVIGKGKIEFEKGAFLYLVGSIYGNGGKINGFPNLTYGYDSYTWNGTKLTPYVPPKPIFDEVKPGASIKRDGITITRDENRIYESMDYVFIHDDEAIGEWEAVDFVNKTGDFDPARRSWNGKLFYSGNSFYKDGTLEACFGENSAALIWTNGYIFDKAVQCIPTYEIKRIGNKIYMYVQWKTDDYTVRGETPQYYVFIKTSDKPNPAKLK